MTRSRRLRCIARALLFVAATACSNDGGSDPSDGAYPNRRPKLGGEGSWRGFVANRLSDTVSVLDLDAMRLLGTAPVGLNPVDVDGPRSLVLDPKRGVAYVALSYSFDVGGPHVVARGSGERPGYVQALSLADLRPLGELRVDPSPGALALSDDGAKLAVSHYDTARAALPTDNVDERRANLTLIEPAPDIAGGEPRLRAIPACVVSAGVVYDSDAERAFVACTGEDSLTVVDTGQGSVVARVPAGEGLANKPFSLVADREGARLLLSNQVARSVALFEASALPSALRSTTVPGVPHAAAFLAGDEWVVPLQDPSGVARIDAARGAVLQHYQYSSTECENPSEARSLADGRLFLVCEGDHYERGNVVQLDPTTLAVVARVTVGIYPDRLGVLSP